MAKENSPKFPNVMLPAIFPQRTDGRATAEKPTRNHDFTIMIM
ncbi:hypothetical protein WG936_06710 [Corynebacterium sp. H127]